MIDLNLKIKSLEYKWEKLLYNFLVESFRPFFLPSHNQDHHKRVWNFAKEILILLSSKDYLISDELIEQTIFASYFHDIGMTITLEKKHGLISCEILRKFLIDHKINLSNVNDVYEAIEYHDNKEYSQTILNTINLNQIINISDDLDAFGAIGVLRYAEIYLLRGMKLYDLPNAVLINIDLRYRNFLSSFSEDSVFISKHANRYYFIKQFYLDFQNQLNIKNNTSSTINPIGIIQFYSQQILNKQNSYQSIFDSNPNTDNYFLNFKNCFYKELMESVI